MKFSDLGKESHDTKVERTIRKDVFPALRGTQKPALSAGDGWQL